MPLTLPNLDDRTYADLLEEARGLLVTLAPDLTNHNPSEPLITLTELFAYFSEVLLFRLNVVTDANRFEFLRLLNGPDWPPKGTPLPLTHAQIDAEIQRAVLNVRTIDRAVTPADYEQLALATDPERIARARCIPDLNLSLTDDADRSKPAPAHVSVVVVPFDMHALDDVAKDVADELDPRRLLTTRVHVVGPRFVPISVHVTITPLPDAEPLPLRKRVSDALKAHFHRITGGDGTGWPFGRSVYVSDIYKLLDDLDGVDFVTRRARTDEVTTTDAFADRRVRNDAGELVSIVLAADELVDLQIVDADIDVVGLTS